MVRIEVTGGQRLPRDISRENWAACLRMDRRLALAGNYGENPPCEETRLKLQTS